VSAEHHWTALDHTFSRLLPAAYLTQGRQRLARRAAALTDIYLPRLMNAARQGTAGRSARLEAGQPGGNIARQLLELQRVHRALSAVLTSTWNTADAQDQGRTMDQGRRTKD
jgi:hypothetical protein